MTTNSSAVIDIPLEKGKPKLQHQPNARWYFGSQAISLTGLMLRLAAQSLFIVALLGKEKAAPYVGLVWGVNMLAGSLLGMFVGLFLDRFDKRRTLQITALIGMAQGFALAYITKNGTNVPEDMKLKIVWEIVLITVIGTLPYTIDSVCRNAFVKDILVHHEDHATGAIVFNSLYNFGLILGNGLAGILVGTIGYSGLFAINALSYIALLIALRKIDLSHLEVAGAWNGTWNEVRGGLKYTFHNPAILLCLIIGCVTVIFGYSYNVILAVINETMFNGGPKGFSYLGAASGIGCAAGSVLALKYGTKHKIKTVVISCMAMGIAQTTLAFTRNINVAALLLLISGTGFMASFLPIRGALMHAITDRPRTGIVLGINFQFFFGGMMISSFLSGLIAKHFGCPTVVGTCGICLLLIAAVVPQLPGIKKIS